MDLVYTLSYLELRIFLGVNVNGIYFLISKSTCFWLINNKVIDFLKNNNLAPNNFATIAC